MSSVDDRERLRGEVRGWLAAEWDSAMPRSEWLAKVVERGYAVPSWPTEWYGLGLAADDGAAIAAEFRRVGAPGSRQDVFNLWANTLLTFGTDELRAQLVRPLLEDRVEMCLLYSEPGAGSDLAGLQTRAERDGDEFVITGQKVWTSSASVAEYGMLIARTDWDVPKHQGISFFFLPMRQPGIEIRPIRQVTGESHFNEVFIDAARVPAANLLGGLNNGWKVLQTALAYERSVMGDVARGPRHGGASTASTAPTASYEIDLGALARSVGRGDEPVLRQRIAQVYSWRMVNRWNGLRAKAMLAQGTSSPIMSLGKLAMSRILHEGAKVQGEILGAETMLSGADNPRADDANFLALNAYFTSIGGGTDQIQRNIIGERVLGLPKEPEPDRDRPFRDVPKPAVARDRSAR